MRTFPRNEKTLVFREGILCFMGFMVLLSAIIRRHSYLAVTPCHQFSPVSFFTPFTSSCNLEVSSDPCELDLSTPYTPFARGWSWLPPYPFASR
jgi:hypothetical protein